MCVCVISWPRERVDPEERVMVFQRILLHGINLTRYVSISSVAADLCKNGQMLIQW